MSPIHLYAYINNYNYNYKIQPIADKVFGEPGVNTTRNMKFIFEGNPCSPLACWYRIKNPSLIG